MVFYRKYRPQKLDDLDGVHVRDTLTSVLSQKDPPHAFLFTGPKGLGKTSAARIVAKVINCTGRKSDTELEPCNKCENCKSITEGTNMDILEIDAASNRGIDEIRDLKEKIRLSPSSARMKVYIIDEVHMLTTEAFNALLKTLEEPPSHAMFILCTTEPQKVPSTIISRCFHISFSPATRDELIRALKRIVKGEEIDIETEALNSISDLAEGGFRDGAKILEELSLLSNGKKVTQKIIDERYKITSTKSQTQAILESFSEYDIKKALKIIEEISEEGIDIKYFIQALITDLHSELLMQIEDSKKKSFNLDAAEIKTLIGLLSNAYQETKYAVIPQLPLEIAALEWIQSRGGGQEEYTQDAQEESIVKNSNGQTESYSRSTSNVNDLRKQIGNIKKIKSMYGASPASKNAPKSEDTTEKKSDVTLMHVTNGEISNEWIQNLWSNVISEMKIYNHTIAGVLRGCSIGSFDKKNLVIQTTYKFHKERLDDIKTMNELSRIVKMLTGKEVSVVVELKSK